MKWIFLSLPFLSPTLINQFFFIVHLHHFIIFWWWKKDNTFFQTYCHFPKQVFFSNLSTIAVKMKKSFQCRQVWFFRLTQKRHLAAQRNNHFSRQCLAIVSFFAISAKLLFSKGETLINHPVSKWKESHFKCFLNGYKKVGSQVLIITKIWWSNGSSHDYLCLSALFESL